MLGPQLPKEILAQIRAFEAKEQYTDPAYLKLISDYYYPEHERTLLWNDSQLAIDWRIEEETIISEKDKIGKTFDECEKYD